MKNSTQNSCEIKGPSQTPSLLKHLQNPCFPVKLLSGFLHTQFICLLKPFEVSYIWLFCIFPPSPVHNVAKYYTSCIIFLSLPWCFSKADPFLTCKGGRLPWKNIQSKGSTYHTCRLCHIFTKTVCFLGGKKPNKIALQE